MKRVNGNRWFVYIDHWGRRAVMQQDCPVTVANGVLRDCGAWNNASFATPVSAMKSVEEIEAWAYANGFARENQVEAVIQAEGF
jgi:hypothetical protein